MFRSIDGQYSSSVDSNIFYAFYTSCIQATVALKKALLLIGIYASQSDSNSKGNLIASTNSDIIMWLNLRSCRIQPTPFCIPLNFFNNTVEHERMNENSLSPEIKCSYPQHFPKSRVAHQLNLEQKSHGIIPVAPIGTSKSIATKNLWSNLGK